MKKKGPGLVICFAKAAAKGIICMVLAAVFASSSFAAMFPIATSGAAMTFAFDGTNYLVGVENHLTSPTSVGAQLINASGNKVGGLISPATMSTGISTNVAFDGTNFLLIWEYDPGGTGPGRFQIYGQFISKAGANVGLPFAITTGGIWFDGVKTMAFGGGKYMVTYTRLINPALGDASNNRYIAGRIVNPNGTMGSEEFRISTGFGKASDVAFDGSNFFVVWCEDAADQEIRGRFVSPAGVPGTELSVNASSAPSDNPKSVAFDGTNYLVIWNDEVGGAGTHTWDCFGQMVSPGGALVGGVITITNETGPQMVTSAAFDGTNYLAVWMDMTNDANGNGACDAGEGTCWDVYSQYISKSGSLVGSKVAVNTDAGNQMGGVGFANGRYLVIVNSGVVMGESGLSQVASANGLFFGSNGPLGTANISISPSPVNFGSVQVGSSSAPQTLTITTSGTGTLTVSSSDTIGDKSQFNIEPGGANPCPDLPHTFAAGTGCTLTATFTPTSLGATTATLVIGSNAVNTPFLNLPLNGTGFGQYSLTTNITGSGSINNVAQPPSFSCSSPSCTASFDPGATFTLRATPSSLNTFAGWNENGCTGSGDCTFTLNGNTTFNVNFNPVPLVQIEGNPAVFQSLQGAYDVVADGSISTLRARNVTFTGNFDLNHTVNVILKSGLESDFITVNGYTYLQGILTLRSGSLTVDNLAIR